MEELCTLSCHKVQDNVMFVDDSDNDQNAARSGSVEFADPNQGEISSGLSIRAEAAASFLPAGSAPLRDVDSVADS